MGLSPSLMKITNTVYQSAINYPKLAQLQQHFCQRCSTICCTWDKNVVTNEAILRKLGNIKNRHSNFRLWHVRMLPQVTCLQLLWKHHPFLLKGKFNIISWWYSKYSMYFFKIMLHEKIIKLYCIFRGAVRLGKKCENGDGYLTEISPIPFLYWPCKLNKDKKISKYIVNN